MDANNAAVAQKYREAGAKVEQQFTDSMLKAYDAALDQLNSEMAALIKRVGDGDMTPGQALLLEQTKSLIAQIEAEYNDIAKNNTFPKVEALAAVGINIGSDMANGQMAVSGFSDYAALGNQEAATLLDGIMSGDDMGKALAAIPGNAGRNAQTALASALLLGQNPLDIARQLRNILHDKTRSELQTLARTTQMTAQRESSIATYEKNAEDLDGWVWMAAVANSPGPCLACWVQHGTVHPFTESMTSHPNCRCTAAPKRKDSYVNVATGEELIKLMSETEQKRLLGPGRFQAWKDGAFDLKQMASYSTGKYGASMGVTPLYMLRQGQQIGAPSGRQMRSRSERQAEIEIANEFNPTTFEEAYGPDLHTAMSPALKRMLPSQKAAIIDYTESGYGTINGVLRGTSSIPEGDPRRDVVGKQVRAIDYWIERTEAPSDMIVYRGGSSAHIGKLGIGDVFKDDGYVSTSTDRGVADEFAARSRSGDPVVFNIYAKKGSKGIYASSVNIKDEDEWVMPRGSQFRVFNRKTRTIQGLKTIVYEVELVEGDE